MVNLDSVIFGQSFNNLENAVHQASNRQGIIAQNIANIESDNYKKVVFKDELEKAQMRNADKKMLLDNELTKLAENNIKLTSYAQLLSTRIKTLKKVVTLGKS